MPHSRCSAASLSARATGDGRDVEVNLFDTALSNLNYLAAWYLNEGHNRGRESRSAHPSLTPSQLYRTQDGWIFIMCNKQKFWPVLCERIGRPEWSGDPRFSDFKRRLANRAELTSLLDAALTARSTAAWLAHFAGSVPAAPVHDLRAALTADFVTGEDRVWTYPHPDRPDFRLAAPAFRLPGEAMPKRAAPDFGAGESHMADFRHFRLAARRLNGFQRWGSTEVPVHGRVPHLFLQGF